MSSDDATAWIEGGTVEWMLVHAGRILFGPLLLAPPWGRVEGGPFAGLGRVGGVEALLGFALWYGLAIRIMQVVL